MTTAKRIVTVMLAVMLLLSVGLMTGCKKKSVISTEPLTLPLEDKAELSWWYPWSNTYTPDYETLSDHPFIKRMEERTNISIEFQIPTESGFNMSGELTAALAAGEAADMITTAGYAPASSNGLDGLVDDGLFWDLTDFISVQMPNFNQFRNEYALIDKCIVTSLGRTVFIPSLTGIGTNYNRPATTGLVIRQDLLTEQQLEVPVTLADWTNVMGKLKTSAGVETPLAIGNLGVAPTMTNDVFVTCYGIMYEFYLDEDGVVQYGAIDEGMKSYVTQMNEWYTAGYINNINATEELKVSDEIAAWPGSVEDISYLKTISPIPNYQLVACPDPVVNKGDVIKHRGSYNPLGNKYTGNVFVTTCCERPDIACKWLDQFFTKEAYKETSYGVEGEDYTDNGDGTVTFTDKIKNTENGIRYGIEQNAFLASLYHDPDVIINYCYDEECQKAIETWSLENPSEHTNLVCTENLQFSQEEQEQAAQLGNFWLTQLGNLRSFITGETPLTEWDSYVAAMHEAGIEEHIAIQQSAWDRFKAS